MDNEIAINNDASMNIKPDIVKITGMGVRLKKAREALHLTEKEAAARLYLNPKIISVIEMEAFSDGPPITFMRGYVRSYARMLSLPETEIKSGLDELENIYPQTNPNKPVLHATPINKSDRYIRWITYLIVATLIVLVTLWWRSHSKYVITDIPNQANDFTQEAESVPVAPVETPVVTTDQTSGVASAPVEITPAAPLRDSPIVVITADSPEKKAKVKKATPVVPKNNTNNVATNVNKPDPSVISNMALALPESE